MPVVAFDTHAAVKDMSAAGFTGEQAEAVTRAMQQARDIDLSNLATKTDLATLKGDLTTTIADTRADILKWMISSFGTQTVVIIGTVLAIMRLTTH